MAIYNKFQSFVEAMAEEKHNLGADQVKVALCDAANAPSASGDAVLTDLVEIAYTNLSTRNVTTVSSLQTAGVYALVLTDLTLTASGGAVAPFRYVILYNDTAPSKELLGWADYGSDLTLADGESLLLDFNPAGAITIQ
jgi:hypothetical protein